MTTIYRPLGSAVFAAACVPISMAPAERWLTSTSAGRRARKSRALARDFNRRGVVSGPGRPARIATFAIISALCHVGAHAGTITQQGVFSTQNQGLFDPGQPAGFHF